MPTDTRPLPVDPVQAPATPCAPLLLRRAAAAALVGVSRSTWDRLSAAARNPGPLKLGGRVLWRRSDVELWVALGLPDRKTFAARNGDARC